MLITRGTLFGGTRTEIHDRKGRFPSAERPDGQDETDSCHRPKAHCRMVQGTVREVKAEHTPTNTTAKEKQRDETIAIDFTENNKNTACNFYKKSIFVVFSL